MDARWGIVLSCVSSFGCAFAATRMLLGGFASQQRRRLLASHGQGSGPRMPESVSGWARGLLTYAWRQTSNVKRRPRLQNLGTEQLQEKLRFAGLEGQMSVRGLCCARMDAALVLCAGGALLGAVLSTELCVIGGLLGFVFGLRSVDAALDEVQRTRKRALEAHLSGAIEAWYLGLRSGLSFDRSLALYCRSFHTAFSAELASARSEWQSGLKTREEALRGLAQTYDSVLFERVVESIVRSYRFGSPLAASLDALALEARRSHRAEVEEQVMKAPVKMMIPVGTLILPSMLLLVLGPVLLELIEGF